MNVLKKILILITTCTVLTGCSVSGREKIITCTAGSGTGEDYHLLYNVYMDFGQPSIEETKIKSLFDNKEQAYVFAKKYTNFIKDDVGSIHVAEAGGKYIVEIKNYSNATYGSLKEYEEMAENLNQKGKVCQMLYED